MSDWGWDSKLIWLYCHECERRMTEYDYRRHHHPERPEKEALTAREVAEALKIHPREVRKLTDKGVLRHFIVERGFKNKLWVRRNDLKKYVKELIAQNPGKAVELAEAMK